MYGSTDMTTLRTRIWPSATSGTSLSTTEKSSGRGQPTGRRSSRTSRARRFLDEWACGTVEFTVVSPLSRDHEVDRDVAAGRVGVRTDAVCGLDELATESGVDALRELDVEDDAEPEALAGVPGEAHVGGDGRVEVLDAPAARDEGQSAREACGIPGGEELLGVRPLARPAELPRRGEPYI